MNTENIKTILLVVAAVVIGGLGYKVFFEKSPAPTYQQMPGKDGKISSPYHEKQIKNTIMKNRGDIITCYNGYIATDPQVTDGPLTVDFEIDDDGEVIRVDKVMGPFVDELFIGCVLDKIKSWQFPEPDINTPVYADHTFRFKKREETAE